MSSRARLGIVCLLAACAISGLAGGCIGKGISDRGHESAEQAAFERLQGTGNVPGIDESDLSFTPSDTPPQGLPNGTITYEAYDSAAGMRYWVFRWPGSKGYAVVPRLEESDNGVLVPYAPQSYSGVADDE